jgi:FkbM family methyltransferase
MGLFRSQVSKSIRWLLARPGLTVFNLKNGNFGFDPFVDIRRLADAWNYPVQMFFDVGANDGDTALTALKWFPEATVFSFEPHPSTFAALTARVGAHSNFRGINVALGAAAGKIELFEYDLSKVNSLIPNAQFAVRFGKDALRIPVHCTTLDIFCEEHLVDQIDVLKIDTEGFDLVVLQGCPTMLKKRAIKFIYVEFNDLQPKDGTFGGALMPIDDLLRPHGYRFVACYNDYIVTEGEMFAVSNALFALPPPLL